MTKQCCAMFCVFLLLSGTPIQASRVAVVGDHQFAETMVATHSTSWGRSCDSLQTRFHNQQARVVQAEGMRSVMATVSFLRTLRRANSRNCEWIHDPNLDMSALRQVAGQQLRQSRCYAEANATMEAARDSSAAEREAVTQNAMLILLSDAEDCSIPEEDSKEMNAVSAVSEDEMEEEIDADTDSIFDSLSDEGSASLLQLEQSPFSYTILPFVDRIGRLLGATSRNTGGDIVLFVGMFLIMICWGILCGFLMEFIRQALRWIRCSMSSGDDTAFEACSGAPPASWFRHVVRAGCTAVGAFLGLSDVFGYALTH